MAGPVIIRRHKVHVADRSLPDVLLGRPLLLCLGIDVEQQLRDIAASDRNEVIVHAVSDSSSPVQYFPDIDHVTFGRSDQEEVRTALGHALARARIAGLPEILHHRFSETLDQFVEVFRVKLGSDPPIKGDPLVIELLPNSVPVLCKPRRFPPTGATEESERTGTGYGDRSRTAGELSRSRRCSPEDVPAP